MNLNLLTIGKLKNNELEKLCDDYKKRIQSPELTIIEIKAYAENPEKEATDAIKKLNDISSGNVFHILLTEWGKKFESIDFSKWLQDKIENHSQVNFIIAGAQGPDKALKDFCHAELSLSELTYPHKLARLILIEQLYRAQTIRQGHPYHN